MILDAALYEYLTGYTPLTDEIGTRLYPVQSAPRSASLPYVIHSDISQLSDHHHAAVTVNKTVSKQFDIYADTKDDTVAIAKHIRDRIDGLQQQTIGTGNVWIMSCRSDSESDGGFVEPDDGTQSGPVRRILEFTIGYQEQ